MPEPAERNQNFAEAVDALFASPEFRRHINTPGFTPWVHLQHAPGRRGTATHQSGLRGRLARPGEDITSDMRAGVQLKGSAEANFDWTPIVNVANLTCGECGQRVTVSELALLELVAGALLRDTRKGAQYVATVR